jgi:deazaflavin-dependent oxidoreductase (nitroreductase family)
MSLTSRQPHGLLKFLLRAPIWLYQAGLGRLMGNRFLMLTHTGRKSGQTRQVVLEVVASEPESGAYFVAAGWRGKADWFQNIQKSPSVEVTVGTRTFKAVAQVVSVEQAVVTYHTYAFHHRQAFRELSRLMMGQVLQPDQEGCRQLAQSVPLVRLTPIPIAT